MVLKSLVVALYIAVGVSVAPASAERLRTEAVQTWPVDSATTAVFLEDHRAPLVEIRLVFPVGKWSPWMRRAPRLADAFALQIMDPAGSLRARSDRLGADLALATDARLSQLSLSCRKPDLDSVAALARDILANRDIDRREFRRQELERKFERAASEKDPSFVLQQTVRRMLFELGDPRREQYEPPPRSTSDLQLLIAMRDTLVRLPGRVIGLAGDLTREEAEQLASRLLPMPFTSASAPSAPNLPPPVASTARPAEKTVHMDQLTQAYVALARDAPGLDDPDFPAFAIADHVLGGYFQSRLYQALRLNSGDVYGTATSQIAEPGVNAYAIWTSTRSANGPAVEAKLRAVLSDLAQRGITEQERSDAVGYMKGRKLLNQQYPGKMLDRILRDRSRGLPVDYRASLLAGEAALSLAEINAFARRFYDPGQFTIVRVQAR